MACMPGIRPREKSVFVSYCEFCLVFLKLFFAHFLHSSNIRDSRCTGLSLQTVIWSRCLFSLSVRRGLVLKWHVVGFLVSDGNGNLCVCLRTACLFLRECDCLRKFFFFPSNTFLNMFMCVRARVYSRAGRQAHSRSSSLLHGSRCQAWPSIILGRL